MTMRLIPAMLLLIAGAATPAAAQMSASDVVMRLEALESQIRQLTGQVEQLQHRNQQLEQQLRRTAEDTEFRFQELGGKGTPRTAQPQRPAVQPPPVQSPQPIAPPASGRRGEIEPAADPRLARRDPRDNPNFVATPNPGGHRGDAFDPNAHPAAPGAPRALGTLPPGQPSAPRAAVDDEDGAPAGRGTPPPPGSPLDLSTMANTAANDPSLQRRGGTLPPPPPRNVSGTGAVAAIAPQQASAREHFDSGYGHILRKDYAAAEQSFREFMQRFPNDRLTADASYWLGESLFQRQRYQDAAEVYLVVTTKYETAGKAPDSLLRLGQSLAAIGQREMACASFAEVGRKYPRSSPSVKQGVEREQKRARC